MSLQLGVDIGGTFTDFILVDESGEIRIDKTPSDLETLQSYLVDGIGRIGATVPEIDAILHGTTIAINTILQLSGAQVGLLTTAGYRDSLEICRGSRKEVYNLMYRNPEPLVPRRLRREVVERLDHRGQIVQPLDLEQALGELRLLLAAGCEAIAVVFLHSYRNPEHELAVGRLIETEAPDVPYTLSHQVAAEWREYERASTTVLNSYVRPRVDRYLRDLEKGLDDAQYHGQLSIMQSTGGSTSAAQGRATPISTIESGPAGGVSAAAALARSTGRGQVIAADVGGTSFDVALVIDGTPTEKSQTEINWRPILVPTLDIVSIGAGGGSIAWVDAGGGLRVGPQSAQADPGPACFGRGGDHPTVTDAYALLGVINPEFFLGNRMPLDLDAAERAIVEHVGAPLSMEAIEAADAVVRLATMNMVLAIRNITIERGHDPREFALVAYGGGGGMFGAYLARELGVHEVVVPRFPANFSAWGILNSDYRYDDVRHVFGPVDDVLLQQARLSLDELEANGRSALREWGHTEGRPVRSEWFVDVRYTGQEHTIRVPVTSGSDLDAAVIRRDFEQLHQFHYSHTYPTQPIEFVNCRIVVTGLRPKPELTDVLDASAEAAVKASRRVFFAGTGIVDCPVYDRELLGRGSNVEGPAIIEEWTSTTLLPPDASLSVDSKGSLIIEIR